MNKFNEQKYLIKRNAYCEKTMKLFSKTIHAQHHKHPENFQKDDQSPDSPAIYGNNIMTALLHENKDLMEENIGLKLFPTYSYMRIYQPGEILEKHTDRPACEVSCTLTIDYNCENLWPFFVESDGKDKKIEMNIGDLVIYRGYDVPHWREPFEAEENEWWMQIFLHYIDENGPFRDHAFDKNRSTMETMKHLKNLYKQ